MRLAVGCFCTVTALLVSYALVSHRIVPAHAQGKNEEIWVNPGIAIDPPADPRKFVAATDAAFTGILTEISVDFIDRNRELLYTTLTFNILEWMYPRHLKPAASSIDVVSEGGTYVEVDGQRIPRKPADIVQLLQIGSEYFVPLDYGEPGAAWAGRYGLVSTGMMRLEEYDVAAVYPHSNWPSAVLAHAPSRQPRPGPPPNRRELFLMLIRETAKTKG